jgi:hypothetical protein
VLWASSFDVFLFGKDLTTLEVASYATFIATMAMLVYLRGKNLNTD